MLCRVHLANRSMMLSSKSMWFAIHVKSCAPTCPLTTMFVYNVAYPVDVVCHPGIHACGTFSATTAPRDKADLGPAPIMLSTHQRPAAITSAAVFSLFSTGTYLLVVGWARITYCLSYDVTNFLQPHMIIEYRNNNGTVVERAWALF